MFKRTGKTTTLGIVDQTKNTPKEAEAKKPEPVENKNKSQENQR